MYLCLIELISIIIINKYKQILLVLNVMIYIYTYIKLILIIVLNYISNYVNVSSLSYEISPSALTA